jgi:hypothetical protein
MEPWISREIATGLAKLISLRLPGCPASDMIEMTATAWIETLCFNRVWDEQRDAPRIRHAFMVLGSTCEQWPAPIHLIQHLPKVEELPALPAKVVSDEVAQENIRKIREMLAGATCPVPDAEDVKEQ